MAPARLLRHFDFRLATLQRELQLDAKEKAWEKPKAAFRHGVVWNMWKIIPWNQQTFNTVQSPNEISKMLVLPLCLEGWKKQISRFETKFEGFEATSGNIVTDTMLVHNLDKSTYTYRFYSWFPIDCLMAMWYIKRELVPSTGFPWQVLQWGLQPGQKELQQKLGIALKMFHPKGVPKMVQKGAGQEPTWSQSAFAVLSLHFPCQRPRIWANLATTRKRLSCPKLRIPYSDQQASYKRCFSSFCYVWKDLTVDLLYCN